MATEYGFVCTIGGDIKDESWDEFLPHLHGFGFEVHNGWAYAAGQATYDEYTGLLEACVEAGLAINLEVDADHENAGEVFAWFPGMDEPATAPNAGDGMPAITLAELRTAAEQNHTINMVIARYAALERPVPPLRIGGQLLRKEDLLP